MNAQPREGPVSPPAGRALSFALPATGRGAFTARGIGSAPPDAAASGSAKRSAWRRPAHAPVAGPPVPGWAWTGARTGRSAQRRAAGAVIVIAVLLLVSPPGGAQPEPAGSTAAVLSFIDAAGGLVEVVRHWPGAPEDVAVRPFVPYFWDGCPGPGAIMMLVTGPPVDTAALGGAVGRALAGHAPAASDAGIAIARLVRELRTPGAPAAEAILAAAPWVSDLATYERNGYAVFVFVRWTGLVCSVSVKAVPEGYGIPFVR